MLEQLYNLENLTYETIVEIVNTHEFEPGLFDYKAVLNPDRVSGGRDEHLASGSE